MQNPRKNEYLVIIDNSPPLSHLTQFTLVNKWRRKIQFNSKNGHFLDAIIDGRWCHGHLIYANCVNWGGCVGLVCLLDWIGLVWFGLLNLLNNFILQFPF